MGSTRRWEGLRVYTVGHSTRSLDELVELLRSFAVGTLVDVRTVPRSRHNPQFNEEALEAEAPGRGFRYVHLARLGGLRHPRKDSPNTGWHNASFRGFADYMRTSGFREGMDELLPLATRDTIALMCAEAVPWRCHRSLIADWLMAQGAHVFHIMAPDRASPHRLTAFARVDGDRLLYP